MRTWRECSIQVMRALLLVVCVLSWTACGGGGGEGTGAAKEEIKAPAPDWSVDDVAYLVKDEQQPTVLVVQGDGFYMRLECRASAAGVFRGSVEEGEVHCLVQDRFSDCVTERWLEIGSGSWEQSVGTSADELAGLRFELYAVDEESGEAVAMRVLGMNLHINHSPDETECSGSVENIESITLDAAAVQNPESTASFQLRVL